MSTLSQGAALPRLNRLKIALQGDRPAAMRWAPWLAVAAALLGGLVLAGWFLDIPPLRRFVPGLEPMKVNTAAGLVVLATAVALTSVARPGRVARRIAAILAAGVIGLAVTTFLQYVLGVSFGIDTVLHAPGLDDAGARFPGRMAIATIVGFVLAGGALLACLGGRPRLAIGLAVGQLAGAWVSLLAYLFGSLGADGLAFAAKMPAHGSVGQGLIAAALLLGPVAGGATLLSRPTPGGAAARRLIAAAVSLLIVAAMLRLAGQRAGLFDVGLGVTLMTAISTLGIVIIALWIGHSIDRLSAERDARSADLAAMFARYQAASEASLDAFYLLGALRDERGNVVDFTCIDLNARGAARIGQTADGARGRRMSELAPGDSGARFIATYGSVADSGETREEEFAVTGLSGTTWVRHQVVKVGDGVAVTSRDVTDAVRSREALATLNAQLAERNADLHDFTSVVSHDIRAPLRRIQMYGEQLETDAGARLGDDLPLLQRMRSGAAKLETLVEELLAYARVEGSDRPRVEVDLEALLAEVVEDLEMPLREAGATVTVAALPAVRGEPILLRQLFTNLIGNAIKFRRPDAASQIDVTASIVPGPTGHAQTEIVVRDNGMGFEQQYADRIFRIFERLHGEREFAGSGVGLAICRKIALYHGGTIHAVAVPGKGAAFTIQLPRAVAGGKP